MKTTTIKTLASIPFAYLALVAPAYAGQVTIPNTFAAGSPAVADEVNANFSAVATQINDNDTRVTTLEVSVGDLQVGQSEQEERIDNDALTHGIIHAENGNSSVALNGTDTTVRSITFIPPFDGFVSFNAQAWFYCTSGSTCVVRCTLNPAGSTINSTYFTIETVPDGQYASLNVVYNEPVTAGTQLDLNMVCDTFTGSGSLGDPALGGFYSTNGY